MKNTLSIALIFLLSFTEATFGQEWSKTTFQISKQPEYDITRYNRILIAEVIDKNNRKSPYSNDFLEEMTNVLMKIEGLEVVDRNKVELLMKEFQFQESGYVDESFFKEKGKFISTGLILTGRLQNIDYTESVERQDKIFPTATCKYTNRRIGTYTLAFNFKLIDLERSEVVFSKTISVQNSVRTSAVDCATPANLNKESIYSACLKKFGNELFKTLSHYTEDVTIKFQKNKKFNENLKQVCISFNIKDYDDAFRILTETANIQTDNIALSSALYNLSISQSYFGQIKEAKENARKSYRADPKNKDALELFNSLEQLTIE